MKSYTLANIEAIETHMSDDERLIELLAAHPTPTDVVARALKVRKCDITLYTDDGKVIVIRGYEDEMDGN